MKCLPSLTGKLSVPLAGHEKPFNRDKPRMMSSGLCNLVSVTIVCGITFRRLCKHVFQICQLRRKFVYVPAYLFVHDACIDLSSFDALVPQDFRYRFNRNALAQRERGSESVPCQVKRYFGFDTARLTQFFQKSVSGIVGRYR